MFTVIDHEGIKIPVWTEGAGSDPRVPLVAIVRIGDSGLMPGETFGLPPTKALDLMKRKLAVLDPRVAAMVPDPLVEPSVADAPVGEPLKEEEVAPVKRGRFTGGNKG